MHAELHVTNGRGILETEASYGDFVMQLDCFVDGDGLNSGVFFRSIPGEFANGYESQIHNGVKDGDPHEAHRRRHRRHLPSNHGPPRRRPRITSGSPRRSSPPARTSPSGSTATR